MNKNKLKCLFGFHEYTIPNKDDPSILMCKHCMRHGYAKYSTGYEQWYDYDKNGNMIHFKDSDGYEQWNDYDKNGNRIHWKDNKGFEHWLHNGKWLEEKPKDWVL